MISNQKSYCLESQIVICQGNSCFIKLWLWCCEFTKINALCFALEPQQVFQVILLISARLLIKFKDRILKMSNLHFCILQVESLHNCHQFWHLQSLDRGFENTLEKLQIKFQGCLVGLFMKDDLGNREILRSHRLRSLRDIYRKFKEDCFFKLLDFLFDSTLMKENIENLDHFKDLQTQKCILWLSLLKWKTN